MTAHDKGRSCERTEEVLANYRSRAMLAETTLATLPRWEPIPDDEACEQIAIGVHTGLRKGTDTPTSAALWKAISDSDDGAWSEAVRFAVWGLKSMGLQVCRKAEECDSP